VVWRPRRKRVEGVQQDHAIFSAGARTIFPRIELGAAPMYARLRCMSSAKQTTVEELGGMLAYVIDHMATRGDIGDLGEQIASMQKVMATKDGLGQEVNSIRAELKSIGRDLDGLQDKVENIVGFGKEIDHALGRIAAIERHLGIDKKIAA
jgi:hypothetical protein